MGELGYIRSANAYFWEIEREIMPYFGLADWLKVPFFWLRYMWHKTQDYYNGWGV